MTEPLVSVVMPACNVERFLAQSIESVLAQTLRDFELIIVDFGSVDSTKAISAKYGALDDRVKLHEARDCTLPEARNFGSFLARGRYIAVMDADDVCLPDRFERQIEFLDTHPEVGLLGGATEWIDAAGQPIGIRHSHPTEDHELREAMLRHCAFWHPTVIVRNDAFVSVGGYRRAFVCSHDYDLELRISDRFACANLDRVVVQYRIHSFQISIARRRQQTLSTFAARISAACRRSGRPDPLNTAEQITPALLNEFGIDERIQESALLSDGRDWLRIIIRAGDHTGALKAALELLRCSEWRYAERWQIADLWLTVARLYWRQRQLLNSISALWHALTIRPAVAGRPFKPLLRRMKLA